MTIIQLKPQSSRTLTFTKYGDFQTSFPLGTNHALGERILLNTNPTIINTGRAQTVRHCYLTAETRTEPLWFVLDMMEMELIVLQVGCSNHNSINAFIFTYHRP
jgi:hypothetical protein